MNPTNVFAQLLSDARIVALNEALNAFAGADAYIVGGAVRDALLNKPFPLEDIDVSIVGASVQAVAHAVQEAVPHTRLVVLDESWGIYRVVFLHEDKQSPPLFLDVVQVQGDDIKADLARRDLTVNALAVHTQSGELLDLYEGQADLDAGVIRALSLENLKDDPLRILRIFRFHATLNTLARPSTLEPATLNWAKACLPYLHTVAKERMAVEWFKLLSAKNAFPTIQIMADAGILEALFPPLKALKMVSPNTHHHLPLWEHSLELVRQAELIYPTLDAQTQNALTQPSSHGASEYGLVKMACLFHDIAKPHTWQVEPNFRHRFIGHEKKGVDVLSPLLSEWKLSQAVKHRVSRLVEWHLYPCTFDEQSSEKSRLRFFRRMEADTPFLIVLALADTLSTRGHAFTPETLATAQADLLDLLHRYWQGRAQRQAPPLLDGESIMQALGIPPSPKVGQILAQLKDVHALGRIHTKEEALDFIRQLQ
jgi:poly(A) polymerase